MKKRYALLAAAAVTGGLVAAPSLAQATPARHTSAQVTCAAFARWSHHRTTGNLDALMATSVHAPWQPLGVDVTVLYTDGKDGDHLDLPDDIKAIQQDCR
jgi:hypothetical protein